MAREERIRRDNWGSEGGREREEEEEGLAEGFHLDCFPLGWGRNARPAPVKEEEESRIIRVLGCKVIEDW